MALRRVISSSFWPTNGLFRAYQTSEQTVIASNVQDVFARIIGQDNVHTSQAIREHHGRDESHFFSILPEAVITPSDPEEVSECVKVCAKHNLTMIPFGTGTGLEGGILAVKGGVTFDLTRINKITDLCTEDFNVTVEPGVTRKGLNNYLRDTGLWFPVDPGADASLCGMAATSASGTNAVRYGTMRENVINLQVVLADGRIMHTAGPKMRARKTSAGYNLTNLFVGSEGTLGMITSATLKLYGQPEATVSAVCQFPDIQSAVDTTVMIQQAGIPIARMEFLDDVQMMACNQYSHLDYDKLPTLFLEFHGQKSTVENQAQIVEELATANGGARFEWANETEARNKLWTARHNAYYAALSLKPNARILTTDVCVPISRLTEMITKTKQDMDDAGLLGPICGHVGDGNFHCLFLCENENKEQYELIKKMASDMAERAIEFGGTCTGEHGVGIGKRQYLTREIGEVGVEVMKQLKQTLDPRGLMNPGKVLL